MKRAKNIMHRLLYPKPAVVAVCALFASALLVYVFCFGGDGGVFAYVSYAFSAYALLILCLSVVPYIGRIRGFAENLANKNRYANRYMTDVHFKTRISLCFSLILNTAYAVLKFVLGIYYGSAWLITLSAYYALLFAMRFLMLRHFSGGADGIFAEWKRLRTCGIVLLFMNFILAGMIVLVIERNEGFTYAGYLIYVMALYDFYIMIAAVVNLVKSKKHNSPALTATKVINLTAALISMLSLETAMITQFGDKNDAAFRQMMVLSTGGVICLIILTAAIFMIAVSTKKLSSK